MFYFKVGFRNIVKNLRKTALTMMTLIFGMAALLIYNGSNTYLFKSFGESTIRGDYGHFQLYQKGFLEKGKDYPFDYLIPPDVQKIADEVGKIPGVKFTAPRLSFSGLISGDTMSTVVMGNSGDPVKEKLMNGLEIKEGAAITPDDPSGIVIGEGLMNKLSGKPGDSYTIMASMKGGGLNGVDAMVKGIKKGFGEYDQLGKMFLLADLSRVQTLLNVPGSADRLIVMLDKTDDMKKIEPKIKDICSKYGLEYRKWDELAVYYKAVKSMFDMNMLILTVIIIAIVIFIIVNTMSMNVMERVKEIGTIRALGTTRIKTAKIFLAEGAMIGIIGSSIGILAGFMTAFIINLSGGIHHAPSVFTPAGYVTFIQPGLSGSAGYFAMFIGVSVLAAVFAANKAAKMAIADALRWIS